MFSKFKNWNWRFIKIVLLTIAIIPILITAYQLFTTENKSIVFLESFHPVAATAFEIYYLILIAIGILWGILQIKVILKLKNEKTKNELMHLQSQVSPHFFFNTLNNLYGLIDVDSNKAKALILKLSDLMRYSIYNGIKSTVSIKEEIEYLKNYIELNRMRYQKNVNIDFNLNIEDENLQVMPLLYIILVENAFKHGVENLINNAFVRINLTATHNEINFIIENNYDEIETVENKGIGIQNLKRRLELVYPNRHNLTFNKKNASYTARLLLKL